MLTAEIVAVKLAVVEPAATVTKAGTTTEELLLARETESPFEPAAVFNVTEQVSAPDPVIELFAQVKPVRTGKPVPLRLIVEVVPFDELLVSVTAPFAAPAVVGLNSISSVAVCPGFNVSGKLAPLSV